VAEPPEVPEGPEVPKAADAKERGIALPPELDQVLRDYERAWQARDPRALADLFAADGCVLADGKPLVRGRSAIRAAYARSGGPRWLRAEKFAAERRTAYIIGVYGHEPDAPETGKFVLALERGPTGRWLIAADIDNGIGPRRAP
jgi:ketosteroid isomerase-like protein